MGEYNAVATRTDIAERQEKQNQIGALSFHPMKLIAVKALGTENTHSSIPGVSFKKLLKKCTSIVIDFLVVFPDEKRCKIPSL